MKYLILLVFAFVCSLVSAAEPFRIQVKTDNPGTSTNTQFTLPLAVGETYNFTINWGDGTAAQIVTASTSPTHTYASAGTYTISITENTPTSGFPRIYFNNGGDRLKLLQVVQWGDVHWTSFGRAFSGCRNLVITATDQATARTGTVTDFSNAWYDCSGLTSFPLINTAAGTNFTFAWQGCSGLTSFPRLNTAAGTNFSGAWFDCSGLTSFPFINTAAGTTFFRAWEGCSGLTAFPLIKTAAGINFRSAWYDCSGLTSFPLINTANGTIFDSTWAGCINLSTFPALDLSRMTSGTECFASVTLPTATYSALLADLAARNTNTSVVFGGGSSRYTISAAEVRPTLTFHRTWTITDGGLAVPIITSPSAASVLQNAAFTYTISASDNPTSFGASGVPSPLTYANGVISGSAPNATGTYPVTISATNAEGTGYATLTLYVNGAGAPIITSASTAGGIRDQAFSTYQITATGSPTSWAAIGLPPGLSCNSTGAITGTPTLVGTRQVSVRATNAAGTGVATLTVTVVSPGGSAGGSGGGGSGGGCGVGALSAMLLAMLACLGFRRHTHGREDRTNK